MRRQRCDLLSLPGIDSHLKNLANSRLLRISCLSEREGSNETIQEHLAELSAIRRGGSLARKNLVFFSDEGLPEIICGPEARLWEVGSALAAASKLGTT